MITRSFGTYAIAVFFMVLLAALTLIPHESRAQSTGNAKSSQPAALTQVESKYVCMVTNQINDKEQLPVAVDGKTYYGCCHMCEAKLKEDPASRVAVDPVSGKEVDKSTAVIGASADGAVYYFENAQDLKAFGNSSNSSNQ